MSRHASASDCYFLIPARGGSKGVPRKNVRPLAGRPLILHTLQKLTQEFGRERVIVSTDCDEIAELSQEWARIHRRSSGNADDRATLDDVAAEVAQWLVDDGASDEDLLFTVQPTSPFLSVASVHRAIDQMGDAGCVISVTDDRHLRWTRDEAGEARPLFTERVNRQWLPVTLAETGGVIVSRMGTVLASGTRIGDPVALLELDATEGLDIDDYSDWAVAEFLATRKRIVIRADGAKDLGMGHVYRALALASEFAQHDLTVVARSDAGYSLGAGFLRTRPYPLVEVQSEEEFFVYVGRRRPDLLVLDILDTEESYVQRLRPSVGALVHLEDLGRGNRLADLVVNDLYSDLHPASNHLYGVQHAILSPQFEHVQPRSEFPDEVGNIMVSYGGTDPQNLTDKALRAIAAAGYNGQVTVVLGPGYSHGEIRLEDYGLSGELHQSVTNMAALMRDADLALTSAGRTVTEFLCLGTPLIVACQNLRELQHSHASSPFGVINLGLGEHVSVEAVAEHLRLLLGDRELRGEMRRRALNAVSRRSNAAVAARIMEVVDQESRH